MQNRYKFLLLLATVGLIASLSTTRALYQLFFTTDTITSTQQQQINDQFDSISGAHIKLEKLIKPYIPNPGSYQHISSKYERIQDQITVYTEYSAINTTGQRNKAEAIVVYHLNGLMINLLKIE